jgi:hypothetical protein
MVKDNKIVTQDWQDYNSIVDSIMDNMDYESNLNKIELISRTMDIAKATYYDVELKFGSIELLKGDNDEVVDIDIYFMCGDGNRMKVCLYSSYLDINTCNATSKENLYQDMRELITKILNDPIDQTLHNNKEIQW